MTGITEVVLNAASRKNLHRIVIGFVIIVFAGVLLIINTPLSAVFINRPSINTASNNSSYCFNSTAVQRFILNRFNRSGGTVPLNRSSSNTLQAYTSFAKENIVKTLSQISSLMQVSEVSCKAIFDGSQQERDIAIALAKEIDAPICDQLYSELTSDCKAFQTYRGYIMSPLTTEEENFPLAFSLIVFKDAEMVERLLRTIYRPQNYYCIHVDQKSTDAFFRALSDIANCFTNVIIASRRIDVRWGKFSVLEPELLCMEELYRYHNWKYFFTLTGQEFPLKSNLQLVRILTAYNGANDVMTTLKFADTERWKGTDPPHGLRAVKGSIHSVMNREFIHFALHNKTAIDLLEWTKTTDVPDETFFAILNANPQLGIRGTYKGEPEMTKERPFLARYKSWEPSFCADSYVRNICILTAGDLPTLQRAKHLFANKFYITKDRVVIGCLEEKIFNDTRDEYIGIKTFNTSYYSNLDFVKNQVI